MKILQQLTKLFNIESEDFSKPSQLLRDREVLGKLDGRKTVDILKIVCDKLQEIEK